MAEGARSGIDGTKSDHIACKQQKNMLKYKITEAKISERGFVHESEKLPK